MPLMAASVLYSSVFVIYLDCFSCFLFLKHDQFFTRDELLNIRQNTPQNLLPVFNYLDIVVGGAAVLFSRYRTHR